ncbi:unnamed protein product, partial [Musa acuminata subsp. burmannicoides]
MAPTHPPLSHLQQDRLQTWWITNAMKRWLEGSGGGLRRCCSEPFGPLLVKLRKSKDGRECMGLPRSPPHESNPTSVSSPPPLLSAAAAAAATGAAQPRVGIR